MTQRRLFLVEHYLPGATTESFRAWTAGVRATAATMARAGTSIRYLRSIVVPEDEAAFCVFAAPSREAVEELYLRAGVRFDRIVDALEM